MDLNKETLAIFDFDKTVTKVDTFNDFLIYRFGKLKVLLCNIVNIFNIFLYALKIFDNYKIKSKIITFFYKNKRYDDFIKDCQQYANDRLENVIDHKCLEIIQEHQDKKHKIVILTASFEEWIKYWAKKNNITEIISTKLEIRDGYITGNVPSKTCCYGVNKKNMLMNRFPDFNKYYSYAYGDSKSDLYFMSLANEQVLLDKKEKRKKTGYAIVTDGLWRKSVSVIRSLGKNNINVAVMGDTYLTTGMWSKYTNRKYKCATAVNNKDTFGRGLLDLINDYEVKNIKPVIVPMEEATLEWCVDNEEELRNKTYMLIPSKESLKIALSKAETIQKAMEVEVPCPKTYFPKSAQELNSIIKELEFEDFIVKPIRGSSSIGLMYCNKNNEYNFTKHWNDFGELVLQERIPPQGEGLGVSVILDKDSNVIASFAHKRIEQYPNSGGPSTSRVSIHDEKLIELSEKLLKSISWIGVAMVEWKFNVSTNEPVLMEINPRFWGSLELAVRAGVDFPYIYYKLATGKKVNTINTYKTGIVCRWVFPGEILRYITKNDRETLSKFLKGIIKESEEWDKKDKRGFFATIFCQLLLALNPKYWKYVKRK